MSLDYNGLTNEERMEGEDNCSRLGNTDLLPSVLQDRFKNDFLKPKRDEMLRVKYKNQAYTSTDSPQLWLLEIDIEVKGGKGDQN